MKSLAEVIITRNIRRYFAFLFAEGYAIRLVHYTPDHFGNWRVLLESAQCTIVISEDRGELLASFAPPGAEVKPQIGLEPIVYFLSNGNIYIPPFQGNRSWRRSQQFTRLADLLRQYLDRIAPLFAHDFAAREHDLLSAQAAYNQRVVQDHLVDWHD